MMKKNTTYRERLLEELGKKKYEELTKSFEVLGNIAVIDVEGSLAKKVARIIMETHRNVETVLRKGGAVKGRYRLRRYVFVAGKRNYTAEYNENGASFAFDVRKVFFSPRLAYERKRIADLCRNGEHVVVMFAGIGPFAIEIAKRNKDSKIVAIELNREGYRHMLENIRRNKVTNVAPVLGDAGKTLPKYRNFADRIIMPLPMDSYNFLKNAFAMAGKRCMIHYYTFVEDGGEAERRKLAGFAREQRRGFRIVSTRVVRPYSSKISEIVIDFEVRNLAKGYKA